MPSRKKQSELSDEIKELVTRSDVPAGLKYTEYREFLRYDFFYSCAYCTIAEAEATSLRMTIDHYEPKSAAPEMEHCYNNLMYACDTCNVRKNDLHPDMDARELGFRFFRPDKDIRSLHFEILGRRVSHKTNVGRYTIEACDLNRSELQRLRELRTKLYSCEDYAAGGVVALQSFPIDRLHPTMRAKALEAIKDTIAQHDEFRRVIDRLLRDHAISPLFENCPETEADLRERLATRKDISILAPGAWRRPKRLSRKRR